MISAFGPRAELYAAGLGEIEAVIADDVFLAPATVEAQRRRKAGQPFYAMALHADQRAQTILSVAVNVIDQIEDYDLCRAALNQLGAGKLLVENRPAEEHWNAGPAARGELREFLSLANGVLVRSFAEGARLATACGQMFSVEPAVTEPVVPAVTPRFGGRPGVVIWSPYYACSYVSWYAFALSEFFGQVVCVTSGGTPSPKQRVRFITPDDPELPEILASVQCVLCPDPDDPGAAVAFARRGFGVAAPVTSGAREYVRDVVSFNLARLRDVEMAVKIAIALPASVRSEPKPPAAPTAAASQLRS